MAEIETRRPPASPISPLMVAIPAALFGAAALSLMFMTSLYGRPNYKVGLYDAQHPVSEVGYRGAHIPVLRSGVTMPDNGMVAVGYTDEGYLLYARRTEVSPGGGGGGGMKPEWGAKPPSFRHLFLRTETNAYQPLVRE